MTTRIPLVIVNGQVEQLQSGDTISPGSITTATRLPCVSIDITSTTVAAGDILTIASGIFGSAGAQSVVAGNTFDTPGLPATGTAFQNDERIRVRVNQGHLVRGADAAALTARNGSNGVPGCYWVSTTQLAFNFPLYNGDVVEIDAPNSSTY